MTFDVLVEVKIPYSTIPVSLNMISSQYGAITTAYESGNEFGKKFASGAPKLSRPFELI